LIHGSNKSENQKEKTFPIHAWCTAYKIFDPQFEYKI